MLTLVLHLTGIDVTKMQRSSFGARSGETIALLQPDVPS